MKPHRVTQDRTASDRPSVDQLLAKVEADLANKGGGESTLGVEHEIERSLIEFVSRLQCGQSFLCGSATVVDGLQDLEGTLDLGERVA